MIAGFVLSAAHAAPDPAVLKECTDCHGDKGISTHDDIPTVAGMSELYLSDNLRFYKNKERACRESKYRDGDTNRPATTMCDVVAKLTDDQIDQLAAYYAGLPFQKAKQPFDQAKADHGAEVHDRYCEKCHENAGSSSADDAGLLAGQWTKYLKGAFEEYDSGKRLMTEKMQVKYEQIGADEKEALLHFYASQQ